MAYMGYTSPDIKEANCTANENWLNYFINGDYLMSRNLSTDDEERYKFIDAIYNIKSGLFDTAIKQLKQCKYSEAKIILASLYSGKTIHAEKNLKEAINLLCNTNTSRAKFLLWEIIYDFNKKHGEDSYYLESEIKSVMNNLELKTTKELFISAADKGDHLALRKILDNKELANILSINETQENEWKNKACKIKKYNAAIYKSDFEYKGYSGTYGFNYNAEIKELCKLFYQKFNEEDLSYKVIIKRIAKNKHALGKLLETVSLNSYWVEIQEIAVRIASDNEAFNAELAKEIEELGDDSLKNCMIGDFYLFSGREEKSKEYYEKSNEETAKIKLALIKKEKSQIANAESRYSRFVRYFLSENQDKNDYFKSPTFFIGRSFFNLGLYFIDSGDTQKALNSFERGWFEYNDMRSLVGCKLLNAIRDTGKDISSQLPDEFPAQKNTNENQIKAFNKYCLSF